MIIGEGLPFIQNYVSAINIAIKQQDPEKSLTRISLSAFIEGIVSSDDPKTMFEEYADKISELFELRSSIKHMRSVDMSFCNP